MPDCIFCKIVAKTAPSHIIAENDEFMAFLSIFPNTKGITVVIPKAHHDSYVFDREDDLIHRMMLFCKRVAKQLDAYFADVGRTALVFEGFGVNHLHAKLIPLHGTASTTEQWQQISSDIDTYFENYAGYISSHDSHRADDSELAALAADIARLDISNKK